MDRHGRCKFHVVHSIPSRTFQIASISREGNVEILANKSDLIYDKEDKLIEHWKIEKILAQYEGIKGVQLVQVCHGAPVCKFFYRRRSKYSNPSFLGCIVVPKKMDCIPEFIRTDLTVICRKNKVTTIILPTRLPTSSFSSTYPTSSL